MQHWMRICSAKGSDEDTCPISQYSAVSFLKNLFIFNWVVFVYFLSLLWIFLSYATKHHCWHWRITSTLLLSLAWLREQAVLLASWSNLRGLPGLMITTAGAFWALTTLQNRVMGTSFEMRCLLHEVLTITISQYCLAHPAASSLAEIPNTLSFLSVNTDLATSQDIGLHNLFV